MSIPSPPFLPPLPRAVFNRCPCGNAVTAPQQIVVLCRDPSASAGTQVVAAAVIVHRLAAAGFIDVHAWLPPHLIGLAGLGGTGAVASCGHRPQDSFTVTSKRVVFPDGVRPAACAPLSARERNWMPRCSLSTCAAGRSACADITAAVLTCWHSDVVS